MQKRIIELGTAPDYQYWTRVNATAARNAAARGEQVLMHPCNLNPYYGMGVFRAIFDPATCEDTFEKWDMYYRVYNCTSHETGYYPAYYLRTEKPDRETLWSYCY